MKSKLVRLFVRSNWREAERTPNFGIGEAGGDAPWRVEETAGQSRRERAPRSAPRRPSRAQAGSRAEPALALRCTAGLAVRQGSLNAGSLSCTIKT